MDVLRTPDERFADLPDFSYQPHYAEVDAGDGSGPLRMAYVDEGGGVAGSATVVMLHGEPSWSFLWRHVMAPVVDAGHRVVAPDLVGFGRSDKPASPDDYTYDRHVAWTAALLDALDLRDIVLVCQDWGGLIGLRILADQPARFAGVVAANTFLPDGLSEPSDAFLNWQRFSQTVDVFPIATIMQGATADWLGHDIIRAYEAPFPDQRYLAGARRFPALVPTRADDPAAIANRAAWKALEKFDRPFVTAFSDGDPITAGGDLAFQRRIAGTAGQPHATLAGGHHFLQEDVGPELAKVVLGLLRRLGRG